MFNFLATIAEYFLDLNRERTIDGLSDGEFFKLDGDFMGARLAATAHESLAANRFAGAAQEYANARQHLGGGEAMDAVFYAAKSFESVMRC